MRVRIVNSLSDIISVTGILHTCGKDMAKKYDIHHWDNPWIKTFFIVLICLMKNKVSIVENEKIVATYQTKVNKNALYFEKLAVIPEESGKGIGSFCLMQIEKEAREHNIERVQMDVYSKSLHALRFYAKHGYTQKREDRTLKYDIVCLEKGLK